MGRIIGLGVALVAAGFLAGRWTAPGRGGALEAGADADRDACRPEAAGRGGSGEGAAARRGGARASGRPGAVTAGQAPGAAAGLSDEVAADLHARLLRAEAEVRELSERLGRSGPRARYDSPTAEGRRRLAARDGNLLLEMPAAGERQALADVLARGGLDEEQRAGIDEAYQEFQAELTARLRGLHANLSGDPDASRGMSISSLVHGITDMTPGQACREAMRAVVAALASDAPVPPPPGDSGCGDLATEVIRLVDAFERAVADRWGQEGLSAIWTQSASFEFSSVAPTPPGQQDAPP